MKNRFLGSLERYTSGITRVFEQAVAILIPSVSIQWNRSRCWKSAMRVKPVRTNIPQVCEELDVQIVCTAFCRENMSICSWKICPAPHRRQRQVSMRRVKIMKYALGDRRIELRRKQQAVMVQHRFPEKAVLCKGEANA